MDAFFTLPTQTLAKYLLPLESDEYLYWSQDWLSIVFSVFDDVFDDVSESFGASSSNI